MEDYAGAVNRHYARGRLSSDLLESLKRAGKDISALTVDDLSPIDEFHIGGRAATITLGDLARLSETSRVLDIGCGVGGPARTLAHKFGCSVTGIDLTAEYCVAGKMLTQRVGLSDRVIIQQGNGLAIPFKTGLFSVAWMQHVTMNINDKNRLFREIRRVLNHEGRLVFYEVVSGENPKVRYPVPWARSPDLSYLASPEELMRLVAANRYKPIQFDDVTEESIHWFHQIRKSVSETGPPALSLSNLMGPDLPVMSKNLLLNIENKSLRVVRGIYKKRITQKPFKT